MAKTLAALLYPLLHCIPTTSPTPSPKLFATRRLLFAMSSSVAKSDPNCIFCKIIEGKIPSMKLYDSDKTYAFLDIGPIAPKHALVIPKYHGAKLHDIPDEHLTELLPIAKRIAVASGEQDYNILQNNGRIAHQVHSNVVSLRTQTAS